MKSNIKITTLLVGLLFTFSLLMLIGSESSLMARERGKDVEAKRKNKTGDVKIPKVLLGFPHKQVFALKQGKKYNLYRFKWLLQVTAVIYLEDKNEDGNVVLTAIRLMDSARGNQYFLDTPMVQVDYCPTQFDSFEDARQAALEGKVVWIKDLIRPPSAFKGEIKTIK